MILDNLALLFGILMALANLPQACKTFDTRSARDISIWTYLILFFGSVVWYGYGFSLRNYTIMIPNLIGMICILFVIMGWSLYHNKGSRK